MDASSVQFFLHGVQSGIEAGELLPPLVLRQPAAGIGIDVAQAHLYAWSDCIGILHKTLPLRATHTVAVIVVSGTSVVSGRSTRPRRRLDS